MFNLNTSTEKTREINKMAKKIAIMNEKGGVGKTATATTTSYLLTQLGFNTLLIDFDGQANSTIINGMNPNNIEITISTLINNVLEEKPLPDDYIMKNENGVHFIPANSELFKLERTLCNVPFSEYTLATVISHFEDKYDYIIIDCMPQMGTPSINVLMCTDEIIIPTQPQLLSVHGLNELINHINLVKKRKADLVISGILITMDEKNTNLSVYTINEINRIFGKEINIFKAIIPKSIKVAEACLHKKTICEFLPGNPAAIAYDAFVTELLELHGEGGR